MTNFDYIKTLTVDEFIDLIFHMEVDCRSYCIGCPVESDSTHKNCFESRKAWLLQEYKPKEGNEK